MHHQDPYTLTLALARGRRLCKTRHADGTAQDYDSAKLLDLHTAHVPDLPALAALLQELRTRQDTCVLRGAILDPVRTRAVRRLLHRCRATGDGPTLADIPRPWIALDFDGLPLPSDLDPLDLAGCGTAARRTMPSPFHLAACVVTATAGHMFKPGARVRLWFMLVRPVAGAEHKRWLAAAPVDRSVFGAAQPIYTAAPRFVGMADPLPFRLAVLPGAPAVGVPSPEELAPPPHHVPPSPPLPATRSSGSHARAALIRATTAVASASVSNRHPTAVTEAWGLARLVAAGLLTPGEVTRALDGALRMAGKPAGEGAAVAAWAISQRAGGARA
jgi:hypothetical protein